MVAGGIGLEGYDPEVECLGGMRAWVKGFGVLVRVVVGGQRIPKGGPVQLLA